MSEYVPTTEDVQLAAETATLDVSTLPEGAFERWLDEYTRVKQAEAWERNSEETEVGGSCSCCGITEVHRPQNPYRKAVE